MSFTLKVLFYKFLMKVLKIAVKLMAVPKPLAFCGPGSSLQLGSAMAQFGHTKVLIVTDAMLHKLGLLDEMKKTLTNNGVEFVVYDKVLPDPTFDHARECLALCRKNSCDCVLGFGGGSPIDVAKVVALAAPENRELEAYVGFLKSKKQPLPLYAVPTTGGTGSEASIGAVISSPDTHAKNNVIDPKIVTLATALDPELMLGLPQDMTAATGMDALTHAVEAYISRIATDITDRYAEAAIRMIFENLETAFQDGQNLKAREAMALASFYAGLAFTRTGTGYVHAIAHQLGGFYGTPHGLANAIVMPYVLEFSMDAAQEKLARLAVVVGLGSASQDKQVLAKKFVDAVIELNNALKIPAHLDRIEKKDIAPIVTEALKEAHYTYAVPKYMTRRQCERLILQMAG